MKIPPSPLWQRGDGGFLSLVVPVPDMGVRCLERQYQFFLQYYFCSVLEANSLRQRGHLIKFKGEKVMKRKSILFLLQGIAVFCLVMFLGAGSAFAYKVQFYNWSGFKAHVRIHVQKLFSQPTHCTFDLDPGKSATCDTGVWCPSKAYATVYKDGTAIELVKHCWGGAPDVDATCCWDLTYDIHRDYYYPMNGLIDMVVTKGYK
jgi:hypothetical protein